MSPEVREIVIRWRENHCAHDPDVEHIGPDDHCTGCVRDVDEHYIHLLTDLFPLIRRDVLDEIQRVNGLAIALKGDAYSGRRFGVEQAQVAANRVLTYHLNHLLSKGKT